MNPQLNLPETLGLTEDRSVWKGGTLSEPSVDPDLPYEQTDKGVQEWLAGDARRAQADRMLDKKRRGYDPGAAEKILQDLSESESNAAQMIYSMAQQKRADAEAAVAAMQKKALEHSMSGPGRLATLIDELLATTTIEDQDLISKLRIAKIELARGNDGPARMIMQEIIDAKNQVGIAPAGNDISKQQMEYAASDLGV
jgi:hypothetical protein